MRLESKKYLFDMLQAANNLQQFSQDKAFSDYEADALLRSSKLPNLLEQVQSLLDEG